MSLRYKRLLAGCVLLWCSTHISIAQCPVIGNLPDTVQACKNTTFQLEAVLVSSGSAISLDTTWTPAAGLSDPNINNPVVTVATDPAQYFVSIQAITPLNSVLNGDFSNGNTGFTSSYTVPTPPYGAYGQLSYEATYAITANPNLVHTNFAGFTDHTGDPAGLMMVINGASSSNTSIWCQTITVLPNTDYDFSAWAASATTGSPAVLQFSINGVLVGTPLSLPAVNGLWTEFHAVWNSGANTSITICINDQQVATSGNDFAIDDIAFRQICTATDSVYVDVTNLTPAIQTDLFLGCDADTLSLTALNGSGSAPDQILWSFGDGTFGTNASESHVYTTQSFYTIKLNTEKNGCTDSAQITINTNHPLSSSFMALQDTACQGEAIQFASTDVVSGPGVYYFDFGDGTTSTQIGPAHAYAQPGVYTVTHAITDTLGCTDTSYGQVVIVPGPTGVATADDSLVCLGDKIRFSVEASPGWDVLHWDFGDGTEFSGLPETEHGYDIAGTLTVTLTLQYPKCPIQTVAIPIDVVAPPTVHLGSDTSLCPGAGPLPIVADASGGAALLWSDSSTGPALIVQEPGVYWVSARVEPGCLSADTMVVRRDCYLEMPNVFTPNGDGVNDYFFPRPEHAASLQLFHMQVFDRWGVVVYEASSLDGRGWDGRLNDQPQPQGVYVWRITAKLANGDPATYLGNVTLLR